MKKGIKHHIRKAVVFIGLAIIIFGALFPIFWMISTSFKFRIEWLTDPPHYIPHNFTFDNYVHIYKTYLFPALTNSFFISACVTGVATMVAALAAYSLSRGKLPRKNDIAFWILSMRMMPPIVIALPLFIVMRKFKLIDTYQGLILVYTTFNVPFAVWLLRGFFEGIPREIEDCALVDGCARVGVFFRIVLPLSKNGLLTTGIFCFVFSWSEFLFALILTRRYVQVMSVTVATLQTVRGAEFGYIAAFSCIAAVPLFILILFAQKNLIRGMTFGAIKG